MKNSDRFIYAYNTIADILDKMLSLNRFVPFSTMVDMTKKKNAIIKHYQEDLKEMAELRNAIVHDKSYPLETIAEPNEHIVGKIEEILKLIQSPPTAIALFKRKVEYFYSDENLTAILHKIKNHPFSQFPVYAKNHTYIGILTDRGIARWLAENVRGDRLMSLDDTTVNDLLPYEKERSIAQFVKADETIYEVRELFRKALDKGHYRLEAVFITENGTQDEKLLGMITPRDMIHFK